MEFYKLTIYIKCSSDKGRYQIEEELYFEDYNAAANIAQKYQAIQRSGVTLPAHPVLPIAA